MDRNSGGREDGNTRVFRKQDNPEKGPSRIRTASGGNKRPGGKVKKKKSVALLTVLAVVLVTVLAVTLFLIFYKPAVSPDPPFDTGTAAPTVTDAPGSDEVTTEKTEPPVPAFTRNKNSVNFLVMGKDKIASNTDVIMIVNFNTETCKLCVVQIPRDTYLNYDDHGGRINTVFAHFLNKGASVYTRQADLRKYAMAETEKAIEESFSINIDYNALVFLDVFAEVVDDIGGVYVDVPCDMYYVDPTPGQELYIDLKAGYQLLDGNKAEQFIRFRSGYALADIGRMDAQKIFLSALLRTLKTNLTVSRACNIVSDIVSNISTDISIADAQYYVRKLFNTDLSNFVMVTMPGDGCQTGSTGAWLFVLNRAAALGVVNTYLNVYNEPIDDSIFDTGRRLTDDDENMLKIYNDTTGFYPVPVTADKTGDIDIVIIK